MGKKPPAGDQMQPPRKLTRSLALTSMSRPRSVITYHSRGPFISKPKITIDGASLYQRRGRSSGCRLLVLAAVGAVPVDAPSTAAGSHRPKITSGLPSYTG